MKKYVLVSNSECLNYVTSKFSKLVNLYITDEWETRLDPNHENFIFNSDDIILIQSELIYRTMVELDRSGVIHLGLRNYNYGVIKDLEVLTVKKCKLVFIDEQYPDIDRIKFFLKYNPNKDIDCNLKDKRYFTLDNGIEGLELLDTNQLMGFDFESFGFPKEYNFEPVGIGISTEELGIYIDFRYYSSDEVKSKFMNYFHEWIIKNHTKLVCYYAAFEVLALQRMFHDVFPLNDALALVRCDDRQLSLKVNAQNYLHVGAWDTEQDLLMDALEVVNNECTSWSDMITKYKYLTYISECASLGILPTEKGAAQASGLEVTSSPTNNNGGVLGESTNICPSLTDGDQYLLNSIRTILAYNIDKVMFDKYFGGPFAMTPTDITGLYCIYDAYYTLKLFKEIDNRYGYIGECSGLPERKIRVV